MATVTEASLKQKAMDVLDEQMTVEDGVAVVELPLKSNYPQHMVDTALDVVGMLRDGSETESAIADIIQSIQKATGPTIEMPPEDASEIIAIGTELEAQSAIARADSRVLAAGSALMRLMEKLIEKAAMPPPSIEGCGPEYGHGKSEAFAEASEMVNKLINDAGPFCAAWREDGDPCQSSSGSVKSYFPVDGPVTDDFSAMRCPRDDRRMLYSPDGLRYPRTLSGEVWECQYCGLAFPCLERHKGKQAAEERPSDFEASPEGNIEFDEVTEAVERPQGMTADEILARLQELRDAVDESMRKQDLSSDVGIASRKASEEAWRLLDELVAKIKSSRLTEAELDARCRAPGEHLRRSLTDTQLEDD